MANGPSQHARPRSALPPVSAVSFVVGAHLLPPRPSAAFAHLYLLAAARKRGQASKRRRLPLHQHARTHARRRKEKGRREGRQGSSLLHRRPSCSCIGARACDGFSLQPQPLTLPPFLLPSPLPHCCSWSAGTGGCLQGPLLLSLRARPLSVPGRTNGDGRRDSEGRKEGRTDRENQAS